jgi:hypothetical protein
MSPSSHPKTLRSFMMAGVVSVAALAAPAESRAQVPYCARALLNQVPLPSLFPQRAGWPVYTDDAVANTGSAERALLARTAPAFRVAAVGAERASVTLTEPVDGPRALLGRRSRGGRP